MKRRGFLASLFAGAGAAALAKQAAAESPPPPEPEPVRIPTAVRENGRTGLVWEQAVETVEDLPGFGHEGDARFVLATDTAYVAVADRDSVYQVGWWVPLGAVRRTP